MRSLDSVDCQYIVQYKKGISVHESNLKNIYHKYRSL